MTCRTCCWSILAGAGLCSAVLLSGCSSSSSLIRDASILARDPGRIVGHPKIEKDIARIVALWEPSNGTGVDDKPARGFAGQILFFGPRARTGCRVRGTVNIYQYDNYVADDEEPQLLHTFSFLQEAWEAHRTDGSLGHSYSCFIPYMNKHKNQVTCGLRVELIGEDGVKTTSEITEVLLPSKSAASRAAALTRGFVRESQIGGRIVPQEQPEDGLPKPEAVEQKLETMTIPLPKR
jgi:hypothetical protein